MADLLLGSRSIRYCASRLARPEFLRCVVVKCGEPAMRDLHRGWIHSVSWCSVTTDAWIAQMFSCVCEYTNIVQHCTTSALRTMVAWALTSAGSLGLLISTSPSQGYRLGCARCLPPTGQGDATHVSALLFCSVCPSEWETFWYSRHLCRYRRLAEYAEALYRFSIPFFAAGDDAVVSWAPF